MKLVALHVKKSSIDSGLIRIWNFLRRIDIELQKCLGPHPIIDTITKLTLASLSKRAKRSLRILTSSSGSHVVDKAEKKLDIF